MGTLVVWEKKNQTPMGAIFLNRKFSVTSRNFIYDPTAGSVVAETQLRTLKNLQSVRAAHLLDRENMGTRIRRGKNSGGEITGGGMIWCHINLVVDSIQMAWGDKILVAKGYRLSPPILYATPMHKLPPSIASIAFQGFWADAHL